MKILHYYCVKNVSSIKSFFEDRSSLEFEIKNKSLEPGSFIKHLTLNKLHFIENSKSTTPYFSHHLTKKGHWTHEALPQTKTSRGRAGDHQSSLSVHGIQGVPVPLTNLSTVGVQDNQPKRMDNCANLLACCGVGLGGVFVPIRVANRDSS